MAHPGSSKRQKELARQEKRRLKEEKRVQRRKEKGEAGRFGPTAFPDIAWPEPTRVPPPWEGGDGRAVESGKGRQKAARAEGR